MTTTRIDHTGHNHPSTTAARTACRKAMKTTPAAPEKEILALVGKGKFTHRPVMVGDQFAAVRCGQGMQRGRRRPSAITLIKVDAGTAPSCHKCH